jgi:hypothetical protein
LAKAVECLLAISDHAGVVFAHFRRLEALMQDITVALDIGVVLDELIWTEVYMSSAMSDDEEKRYQHYRYVRRRGEALPALWRSGGSHERSWLEMYIVSIRKVAIGQKSRL